MSNAAKDQGQDVPTKDAEQAKAETVSTNDAAAAENSTDSGAPQEQLQQTAPGPKALRSHYRGMPRQWEKNQRPKKDGE